MVDTSQIQEHAEVIGADGVHVGTVDHMDGHRIKLTKKDSTNEQHHYIDSGLIASVEGGVVRLSANADVAVTLEETDADVEAKSSQLDQDLKDTFPASDPVAANNFT